jgi:hypothetical protein
VLSKLEDAARTVSLDLYAGHMGNLIVTRSMRFANCGTLIATHPQDLRTVATLDFDFQTYKVHASLNERVQPGQPQIGPRRAGIYWWTPGDPKDDAELPRLLADWVCEMRINIMDGLPENRADYYRHQLTERTTPGKEQNND